MSYDIYLEKDGVLVNVPRFCEGGTYPVGGSLEAHISITYNYSTHFYKHLDPNNGIRWLYGKTGAATQAKLADAITILGTKQDTDYWAPTPGNAGYALFVLLAWARLHPHAVWRGD